MINLGTKSDPLFEHFVTASEPGNGLADGRSNAGLFAENQSLSEFENRALRSIKKSFSCEDSKTLYQEILMASDKELDSAEEDLAATVFSDRQRVFDFSQDFLSNIDVSAGIKKCFSQAIEEVRTEVFIYPCFPPVDFVFATLSAEHERSKDDLLPLAAASLYYYIGVALYDDVIDHDLGTTWSGHSTEHVGLTAIGVFAGLPAKIFQHYYAKPNDELMYAKLSHIVLELIYYQAVGQYQDLEIDLTHNELPQISEQTSALKVGTTGGLTGRLVSEFLKFPDAVARHFIDYCTNMYTAMQISSDIFDIWSKPVSPDFTNATVTLPIAYTFLSLPEEERIEFKRKLELKNASMEHHNDLRQTIEKTNAFLYSLAKAETYRQKAFMSLLYLEEAGLPISYLRYFTKVTAICKD